MKNSEFSRRRLIWMVPAAAASLTLPGLAFAQGKKQVEVTPTEDLMREHGLLKRILLIYDEVRSRIATQRDFSPEAVVNSAKIIRNFIEQYHEKLEEDYLFPRFREHNLLIELVDVLQQQHQAGRGVTEQILALASAKNKADKQKLADSLQQFVRMYAPHEAREDTVLFPALHTIVSPHEYGALGEDFEKKEHQLFGKEGFEGMVPRVAEIEKQLGIYDLNQFTPR
jgi:hemerythrin-like domain-containing protein